MGLKIEAGKYYKSVRGLKAYCVGQSKRQDGWLFEAIDNGNQRHEDCRFYVDNEGRNFANNRFWDIAAEWVDPKPIRGWLNLYRVGQRADAGPTMFSSKRAADDAAEMDVGHRVACIEIDVLEGTGLDGEGR